MLAECGHVFHARFHVGEGGRRQQRFGGPVLGADGAPAVPLPQLWMCEHLVEIFDLCGGDACRRQARVKLSGRPALGMGGDDGVAFVAVADSRHVCGETGIVGQLRRSEDVGDQRAPARDRSARR